MQSQIENYPDISFIDGFTLEDAIEKAEKWYVERWKEIKGEDIILHDTDEEKMLLDTIAYIFYQAAQYCDNAGKMNLLKYSMNDFLDNIGARTGVTRTPAQPSRLTVRFTLSEVQESDYTIPEGTRVSGSVLDDLYFATPDDVVISAGDLSADITCICTTSGADGNGIDIGVIDELVDTLPYMDSVTNITKSDGGTDREDDDAFAERIYLAPSTYSTTGTEDAYIYHAKSASTLVNDVSVYSPEPCYVSIIITSKTGMPSQALIDIVTDYLNDKKRKVLTDRITVEAPTPKTFNVDLTYYISYDNQKYEESIREKIETAVEDYLTWQTTKIGRNVTPSKLVQLVMEAGANRVSISSPADIVVDETELAVLGTKTVTYGGLEYE